MMAVKISSWLIRSGGFGFCVFFFLFFFFPLRIFWQALHSKTSRFRQSTHHTSQELLHKST